MKAKAALTEGPGKGYKIVEIDLPEPGPGEVLVRFVSSGICGTDVLVESTGVLCSFPAILGHEGSGIIEKVGPGVDFLKEGDHVVLGLPECGHCEPCLTGFGNRCENSYNFEGTMPDGTARATYNGQNVKQLFAQGSFRTRGIVMAAGCKKVDNDIDLRILGPIGCGHRTGAGVVFNYIKPQCHESIAVYGVGTVGLAVIMAAKANGIKNLIALDVENERLELAKELGATHIFNIKDDESYIDRINSLTEGGVHYAIEATGYIPNVNASLKILRIAGTYVGIASILQPFEFDYGTFNMKNLRMIATNTGEGSFTPCLNKMLSLYKEGRFPFERLNTYYKLDDINQAFEDFKNKKVIKPVLLMNED